MTKYESKTLSKIIETKKSVIAENILNFQGKPISFLDYIMSANILDCDARNLMVMGGRQISKSFTWGVDMIIRCAVQPYYYILYVAPTLDQTKTFSNEKIRARIMESPKFKRWFLDKNSIQNVFEKDFVNGSHMYFRAATQGDTIRGISVDEVRFDEIQDIPSDIVPIVEETITGKKNPRRSYAGTAKTISNFSSSLWNRSTKISPILVCPDCRKHNVPYIDNIAERGLICKFCKGYLSVRLPHIKFIPLGDVNASIVSFWIPQIALPLHVENKDKWAELCRKYREYSSEQFLNEVMGIPAGEGLLMLNEDDIKKACQPEFKMWPEYKHYNSFPSPKFGLIAGIDWAVTNSEGKSFTVLMIGGYNPLTYRFTIVYAKRFTSPDLMAMIDEIAYLCTEFRVNHVVGDWGSGVYANKLLAQKIKAPVMQVMYTNDRKKMFWDKQAGFYKASRTKTLLDTINWIKAGKIHFFSWEEFKLFSSHLLAEYAELRKDRYGNETLYFDHPPDQPDDALHALNLIIASFNYEWTKDRK